MKSKINFASKLEANTWETFKKHKIKVEYEPESFVLHPPEDLTLKAWKFTPKRKMMKIKRLRPITYTPDFIGWTPSKIKFYMETKGMQTPRFRVVWKMFLSHIQQTDPDALVFMPRSMKDVNVCLEIILDN